MLMFLKDMMKKNPLGRPKEKVTDRNTLKIMLIGER
jgi:hypothetical protein